MVAGISSCLRCSRSASRRPPWLACRPHRALLQPGPFRCGDWIASTPARARNAAHLQIGLDWAALTATVWLTEGINSPLAVAFVFHLIIAAILLSRRACYLLTTAAVVLTATFAAQSTRAGAAAATPMPQAPLELCLVLSALFVVTTLLATSITSRLRDKEAALYASERSVERAYRTSKALYALGQLVNSTLDLDEVLALIARHATRLLHGKAATIRLLDRSGQTLVLAGAYGLSDAYVNKGTVNLEDSVVDADALDGRVVQALDVTNDPRFQYPEDARREGLRSMLSCPMTAKNRKLGVIRVYTAEVHAFSLQEENLLLNLANLGAVAIENAQSYQDLQRVDRERVWFARTTHHQLRAPLAAVQGAIDALEFAGPLNATQQDLVTRARSRVHDAFDTIRDLLDLAAAQRFQEVDGAGPVRPAEPLRRALERAREQARYKGLSFREEIEGVDTVVWGTADDLEKIFANLLTNAVNYTFSGEISVGMRPASGSVEVWVEDTGIGIEMEEQDRIFESFYRSPAAKSAGVVGTGLGLSIVSRPAQRLEGRYPWKARRERAPGSRCGYPSRSPSPGRSPGSPGSSAHPSGRRRRTGDRNEFPFGGQLVDRGFHRPCALVRALRHEGIEHVRHRHDPAEDRGSAPRRGRRGSRNRRTFHDDAARSRLPSGARGRRSRGAARTRGGNGFS